MDDGLALIQTSQPETAIIKYRTVHVGPKTQEGGVQTGFFSVTYQSLTEAKVNSCPAQPIRNTKHTNPASDKNRFNFSPLSFVILDQFKRSFIYDE